MSHSISGHLAALVSTLDTTVVSMGPTHVAFGMAVSAQGVAHLLLRFFAMRKKPGQPKLVVVEGGLKDEEETSLAA